MCVNFEKNRSIFHKFNYITSITYKNSENLQMTLTFDLYLTLTFDLDDFEKLFFSQNL